MSKYQPLADHLAARKEPYWRASFEDLEAVLGFALPKTAHASAAWWTNAPDKPHQRAWLDQGWRVESVDRAGEAVLFHRDGYQPADELPERYFTPPQSGTTERIKRMMGLTAVVGGVAAVAAGLGAVAFRAMRRRG